MNTCAGIGLLACPELFSCRGWWPALF
jgi:hypothetical protein